MTAVFFVFSFYCRRLVVKRRSALLLPLPCSLFTAHRWFRALIVLRGAADANAATATAAGLRGRMRRRLTYSIPTSHCMHFMCLPAFCHFIHYNGNLNTTFMQQCHHYRCGEPLVLVVCYSMRFLCHYLHWTALLPTIGCILLILSISAYLCISAFTPHNHISSLPFYTCTFLLIRLLLYSYL